MARLVPALAPVRRLSKTIIVKESLRHFKKQRAMCLSAAEDMRDLVAQNHRLIAELNELRFLAGEQSTTPLESKPVSEAMAQLMNVPNEVCGTFPAGFGDNWAHGSHDIHPAQSDDSFIDHTGYCLTSDDIPMAVEPPNPHQYLNDHEIVASNLQLAEFPFSAESLSQPALSCSLSPHTPVDLPHTISLEGHIPGRTQLEYYMPFDTHRYPTVLLDTMPVGISTALWMQGIPMPESVQSALCGTAGTVDGIPII